MKPAPILNQPILNHRWQPHEDAGVDAAVQTYAWAAFNGVHGPWLRIVWRLRR